MPWQASLSMDEFQTFGAHAHVVARIVRMADGVTLNVRNQALLSGTAECTLRLRLHTPASFFCSEVSQPQWSFQSVPTETDTFATRIVEWGRAALGSVRREFNRFAAMVRELIIHLVAQLECPHQNTARSAAQRVGTYRAQQCR